MKKLRIQLPTNKDKIYDQIVGFFNFAMDLSQQERRVLAKIIKLNHEYEALPVEQRVKFIMSTDMRKEMRTELSMSEANFNNIVSRLKKKTFFASPILSEDNLINSGLMIKTDSEGINISIELVNEALEEKNTVFETTNSSEVEAEVKYDSETTEEIKADKELEEEVYILNYNKKKVVRKYLQDQDMEVWADIEDGICFPITLQATPKDEYISGEGD